VILKSLILRNFRSYAAENFSFHERINLIYGDNAQGKTNLLEAAYYLSLLRSVRGARDADVVRFGAHGFFIDATLCGPTSEARRISIGFDRAGRRKRVRRDGAVVDRLSDALGALPAVMFAPTDVELVSGSPGGRRRYLDIMLSLTSRAYLNALQQYRAALERRNASLREVGKDGGGRHSTVPVWETPLAEHGAVLIRTRRAWVARVEARFAAHCHTIGEQGRVALQYESSVDPSAESLELALSDALAARRVADLRHGLTSVGPHRDDMRLMLDGRELRAFGSAGQHRTAAIALRTLEAETVREARSASPVFLLDDPFAELDAGRAARVLQLLRDVGLGQSILVVPRDSDIPTALTELPRCRIANGQIHVAAP